MALHAQQLEAGIIILVITVMWASFRLVDRLAMWAQRKCSEFIHGGENIRVDAAADSANGEELEEDTAEENLEATEPRPTTEGAVDHPVFLVVCNGVIWRYGPKAECVKRFKNQLQYKFGTTEKERSYYTAGAVKSLTQTELHIMLAAQWTRVVHGRQFQSTYQRIQKDLRRRNPESSGSD